MSVSRRIKDPMSIREYAKRMSELCGITQERSRETIDYFNRTLADCLANGESVQFEGFYTFGVKETQDTRRRNPQTGEFFIKKAHKLPYCGFSKTIYRLVDGEVHNDNNNEE